MAGMEVSKIQVADIQPKEIDRPVNSVSGKAFGDQVDKNDSVKQSKDETGTINTYKTTEFNPDDITFPE
jgi:hypothetical protein